MITALDERNLEVERSARCLVTEMERSGADRDEG
jgi:hypothetical protein